MIRSHVREVNCVPRSAITTSGTPNVWKVPLMRRSAVSSAVGLRRHGVTVTHLVNLSMTTKQSVCLVLRASGKPERKVHSYRLPRAERRDRDELTL